MFASLLPILCALMAIYIYIVVLAITVFVRFVSSGTGRWSTLNIRILFAWSAGVGPFVWPIQLHHPRPWTQTVARSLEV